MIDTEPHPPGHSRYRVSYVIDAGHGTRRFEKYIPTLTEAMIVIFTETRERHVPHEFIKLERTKEIEWRDHV